MTAHDDAPVNRAAVALQDALVVLLAGTTDLPANEIIHMVSVAGRVLGAESARMLIADYGLTSLQAVGLDGPTGLRQPIEGTMPGRCFARGDIVISTDEPGTVWIPLSEGSERLGVLELHHAAWTDEVLAMVGPVIRVLVLTLVSKRRYTDVILRGRRSQRLSQAAEMQWDLLPPVTYTTGRVSVSGILEPAYAIGGDSFDYALNPDLVEFSLIDAVGHGLPAVMMSVAAINSLRNARREGTDLETAYHDTGELIAELFGESAFVTAQLGELDLVTGQLSWLNAGHPLPLLVRDGSYTRALRSRPSLPMGLGGQVAEITTERLQPGDRVLFYTDGVIESRSLTDAEFGMERLADFLVRATLEGMSPNETVRRLGAAVLAYNGGTLRDDATLFLLEYHGPTAPT